MLARWMQGQFDIAPRRTALETHASRFILVLATMVARGACSTDTLPDTNTPGPTAAYATQPAPAYAPQPTTTQQVVTTTTTTSTSPTFEGTLAGPPATYVLTPGSGSSTYVAAPARMSANEILAVVSGSTASGTTADGKPYYAKFHRDGGMTIHEGSTYEGTGSWRVMNDGQLCSRLVNVNSGI